ncbi:MAG: hypothetical protein SAJ72_07500 [Jaaginema sp. PMC 1080.18]|nr:hypothetical protein [Jaaginema sp. PMC 1080.18]MEC4866672.1 hypothetical protein [Jaaginema sp. PMC 1078.18]
MAKTIIKHKDMVIEYQGIFTHKDIIIKYHKEKISRQYQLSETELIFHLAEAFGIYTGASEKADLPIFVNGQTARYQKEIGNFVGAIQLSPVKSRKGKIVTVIPEGVKVLNLKDSPLLYDSGAFSEVLVGTRTTPEHALKRQLQTLAKFPHQPKKTYLVSYDLLIDEKHIAGHRIKQRWSLSEGEKAVQETIAAAAYLSSQRRYLPSNCRLVLSCQGVNTAQYERCVQEVLSYCESEDTIGLGGWCILGQQRRWLPTFWETIERILPIIASAQIKHIHIFGVSWWRPGRHSPQVHTPLGSLLWLCDRYGLSLTTDSRSPIARALRRDKPKAGALHPYWRYNLALERAFLARLRQLPPYKPPPPRQLRLFD